MNGDLDIVAALARAAAPPMAPLQRMRGLEAVVRRGEARQRKRLVFSVAAGLAACGLVAAGLIGVHAVRGSSRRPAGAPEGSPISYRVEHGEIGDGGYLRAHDRERDRVGVGLRFAEGSELRLAAGARGRLTSVDAQGARFAIEQGEAQVSVTPRPAARWLIDAGPFLITVQGTRFSAAWDGATERLDIRMKHGLVSVTGPVADGKIAVRAGQRLTINVQKREVLLRPSEDLPPDTADEEAPRARSGTESDNESGNKSDKSDKSEMMSSGATGASAPPARAARATRATAGAVAALRRRGWTAALAAGDFQTVLEEAQHRGWRRSLAEARSEDLAALADAARYLRRDDLARQALITQRHRFPRTDRAHEAAFLLGRLSETGRDGDLPALSWYDRYLDEVPRGAYAAEAMGRKMTATERLKGVTAAREIAQEYLRRFPHGTYAGTARALAGTR
ncbi:MAG TPA: FecR domain-containing protein [Polyangia bacterium]|nr:FecR domain-containing protein [Polyangia bacterium]